jgi:hypothetical protein
MKNPVSGMLAFKCNLHRYAAAAVQGALGRDVRPEDVTSRRGLWEFRFVHSIHFNPCFRETHTQNPKIQRSKKI